MEFMIAWYPLARFFFFGTLISIAFLLLYKKWYKTSGTLFVALLLFTWFAPVKIDGTQSKSAHKAEVYERSQEYRIVEDEKVVVTTDKPTFAERMAAEEKRSSTANKKVEDEMLK